MLASGVWAADFSAGSTVVTGAAVVGGSGAAVVVEAAPAGASVVDGAALVGVVVCAL